MAILFSYDSPFALDILGHYPLQDHIDSQGLLLCTPRLYYSLHCSLIAYPDLDHNGEGHVLEYHVALHHHD